MRRDGRRDGKWLFLEFFFIRKLLKRGSFLKEQYPVTAHATIFDFWTGCREIKRCEKSKRSLKNPFASRLAEFNTILKLLRITDQCYIVPVKFRFGRNLDFLALLLLPLAGGPKEGKRFDVDWKLISSASFHTSSDSCKRNTQKWNSSNKDCKKETIETLMWLRRSFMEGSFVKQNVLQRRVSKLLNEPPMADKIKQTGATCLEN